MKTEWNKPQLVVVARGSREENVLYVCKVNNSNGPSYYDTLCMFRYGSGCIECYFDMPS